MPSPAGILSSTYLTSTCRASSCIDDPRSCIRACCVLLSGDGDGILLNCCACAANDAYGSRSGDRRRAPERSAPGCPSLPGAHVTPIQTSRACASSLRRVNALRGTLNSRIPVSSLRPHVRSAHAGLLGIDSAKLLVVAKPMSRRSKEEVATTAGQRRARTNGNWAISRIFPWAAGMHLPVRRILSAGGRMFEFLIPSHPGTRRPREMR
jgi:hypothetical protein